MHNELMAATLLEKMVNFLLHPKYKESNNAYLLHSYQKETITEHAIVSGEIPMEISNRRK